jgi:hypothetical protein
MAEAGSIAALSERLGRLEAEVDALRSADAIKSLHRRYIRYLADRKWEEMHEQFDEDVVTDISFNGEVKGKDALKRMFDRMATMSVTHDAYVLSSPVIEVNGDHATGEWTWHRHYCELMTRQGAAINVWGPWMEGRYKCEYRRRGGVWRFSRIWFRTVAPDPGLDDRVKAEMAAKAAKPT